MGGGMQHSSICVESLYSSDTLHEYTRRGFTSKQPDVSHFKIFGSSVYVHVTKDARKKLEPTTEIGIFVGYTETPHNY